MVRSVYFQICFIFFIFQTIIAQLTDSGINPFPVPVQSIADILTPLAKHACTFVGIQ